MDVLNMVAACAIVYDHEKQVLLMGLRGDCNQWSFAGGRADATDVGDSFTARRELAEEFGMRFDSVKQFRYAADSANIHQTDLGHVLVPGRKSYFKGKTKLYKDVYYYSHIFLYEMNKSKATSEHHILKGVKDKEMEKVRWVKLSDVPKLNLWPATVVVFNAFLRYWVERNHWTGEDIYELFGAKAVQDDTVNR